MTGRGPSRRWRLVRARTDAIPASVRRFNQRARQRRLGLAIPWLVIGAALGLSGLVGWLVLGTGLLGVRAVEVRGNATVTADEIRAAAAVRPGAPLASLDLRAVGRRVGALTAVSSARVTRDWPSTIVIQVTERSAVAALTRVDQRYDLIDGSGMVFRTVATAPSGLPRMRLSSPGPDDPTTRAALSVLSALTPQLRAQLVILVASAPTRISLTLSGDRQVIWGDATDNGLKATAATSLLAGDSTVIDVSAPSFVTVR
jgi:cell division protein FtsQ